MDNAFSKLIKEAQPWFASHSNLIEWGPPVGELSKKEILVPTVAVFAENGESGSDEDEVGLEREQAAARRERYNADQDFHGNYINDTDEEDASGEQSLDEAWEREQTGLCFILCFSPWLTLSIIRQKKEEAQQECCCQRQRQAEGS